MHGAREMLDGIFFHDSCGKIMISDHFGRESCSELETRTTNVATHQNNVYYMPCFVQVGDAPNFDKTAWNQEKPRLQKECGMHFPNLPFLLDTDGTALSQTHTIMRYLASSRPQHGLMGSSLKQTTQADLLSEVRTVVLKIMSLAFCIPY
jgi:hypothetical protein